MNTKINTYRAAFAERHIGPDEHEITEMLNTIGVPSLDELIHETIPEGIRLKSSLDLGKPFTEQELLLLFRDYAKQNRLYKTYIGYGYYSTYTPAVILRNIMENPGWYTQYTPYQAEISQGRLEALLNFQTAIIDLTGLEVANASLLDEGTAAAEAMHVTFAASKKKNAKKFFVSDEIFKQTIDVIKTRSGPLGIEPVIGNWKKTELTEDMFGLIVQYPSADGEIYDYTELFQKAKSKGIFCITAADIMSLTMLKPPGEFGTDIAVGSTQRFGIPKGYGGPHAAYFSCKDEFKRIIPGRIIGVSIDRNGNTAYRMALQTREQHIRREKATSNICTSQVLLAIMAGMYAVYHGPAGLRNIAERIHDRARYLDFGLKQLGYKQLNKYYFDTLKIDMETKSSLDMVHDWFTSENINLRYYDDRYVGISVDETTSQEDIDHLLNIFGGGKSTRVSMNGAAMPESLKRKSKYLTHPVFNTYRSETDIMRYIKKLENKDIALNRSMIPLGSCTMKLNAATEMIPVTWAELGNLHPFIPEHQAEGYIYIIRLLERGLAKIAGLEAVSLQPNSGAQGEFTGLMVIKEYHKSRNEQHRDVVLIPASAHGTNPASAIMAGMKVVVVKTTEQGDIDLDDLCAKAIQYKKTLAALMITYPSTHGVFEESIVQICDIIHENGGQVYMDGANLNAQVGLTNPGVIGADLCHINLHKTFCIPHGGGGPGMGPIAVSKHLAPFLPGHSMVKVGGDKAITAVSSAPWGSASILPISLAYILMMGGEGLTQASKVAILNVNYVKAKLEKFYPVLYSGKNGRCAHELIFDLRSFKHSVDIEAEDIAKRLIDYGFHAPTLSFPVPGTFMFEPTESESKAELDRFCDAMIAVRHEIKEIEDGIADKEDNVLKNAPHTAEEIASDSWSHKYTREKAAFPLPSLKDGTKYWSPVARVDNAYGDRNFMCSCVPVEAYAEGEAVGG